MTIKVTKRPIPPADRLWTSEDVAIYIRLEPKFGWQVVERWAREGKLKGGKAGDKWRFQKQDVDDFVFSGS